MLYFFVSAASAYLCWRATDKGSAGGAEGALEDGKGGGDLTSQSNDKNVDGRPATATTHGPGPPVPLALRRLQLVVWNIACVVSLVVVALFWFADVSTARGKVKTVSASARQCPSVGVLSRVLYSRSVP